MRFALTVAGIGFLLLAGGCHLTREKQLEVENTDLKSKLAQHSELMKQLTAECEALRNAIRQSQVDLKQSSERELARQSEQLEIQKQLHRCKAQLAQLEEYKGEAARQSVLAKQYQNQIQSLTEELEKARERIKSLERQLDDYRGKTPTTSPG